MPNHGNNSVKNEIRDTFAPLRSQHISIHTLKEKLYILKHEKIKNYILINDIGLLIWGLLNGTNTIYDIENILKHQDIEIKRDEIKSFIATLGKHGFLENFQQRDTTEDYSSAFIKKFPLLKASTASKMIAKIYKYLGWTLNKPFTIVATLIILCGGIIFFLDNLWTAFRKELFTFFGSSTLSFLIIPLFYMPIIILHEIYHGLACTKYKVEVLEIGFIIYYFYPGFYCDTTDAWLTGRRERIYISLAGPYSTLLLWAIFILINKLFQIMNFVFGVLNKLLLLLSLIHI